MKPYLLTSQIAFVFLACTISFALPLPRPAGDSDALLYRPRNTPGDNGKIINASPAAADEHGAAGYASTTQRYSIFLPNENGLCDS